MVYSASVISSVQCALFHEPNLVFLENVKIIIKSVKSDGTIIVKLMKKGRCWRFNHKLKIEKKNTCMKIECGGTYVRFGLLDYEHVISFLHEVVNIYHLFYAFI